MSDKGQKINFNEVELCREDINSLTVENENHRLTDKELGRLARQILIGWFLPMLMADDKKSNQWFAYQMRVIKDLLVKYRTEQVLAGIEYWTKINPPKKQLTSLRFLSYKDKGTTKMMQALDYYKSEYVKNSDQRSEMEEKIEEANKRKQQEAEEQQKRKAQVDNMTNEEFLASFFNSLPKVKPMEKKNW